MRRHRTDLVSLVAGLLFTTLGVVFLLGELRGLTVEARWVVPVERRPRRLRPARAAEPNPTGPAPGG